MQAVRWGIGGAILLAGLALFAWFSLNVPARTQRFVLDNQYRDADCRVEFDQGYPPEEFSVAMGKSHEWVLKAPRVGFVTVKCAGPAWHLESPGHFRFIDGGLAQITLKPWGEMDVRYEGVGRF